jgi:hypothetical protein
VLASKQLPARRTRNARCLSELETVSVRPSDYLLRQELLLRAIRTARPDKWFRLPTYFRGPGVHTYMSFQIHHPLTRSEVPARKLTRQQALDGSCIDLGEAGSTEVRATKLRLRKSRPAGVCDLLILLRVTSCDALLLPEGTKGKVPKYLVSYQSRTIATAGLKP